MHRFVILLLYVAALAAPCIAPLRLEKLWARPLAPARGEAAPAQATAFASPGVYPLTDAQRVPATLALQGSWVDGDEFQGAMATQWYAARRTFTVLLAGYPALAPNRLDLELRQRDGTVVTITYAGENPGETWREWAITLPPQATAFRLRATDASSAARGWLAFSAPFVDVSFVPRQVWPIVQLTATTCLAVVLLYGPGWLWLRRRPRTGGDLALAAIPGPVLLALLGLACWVFGDVVAPATLARIGMAGLLVGLGVIAWRTRALPRLGGGAGVTILAGLLLAGFSAAKANLSIGPAGELFRDTVSRTLAVGGHSDSRTSYHIVQLVAHHAGPFSEEAASYYSPWSIANRGPIGGLLAAPVVLGLGAAVQTDSVNHPWEPFDRDGFAVYRITQIVLASLAGWAVFGAVEILLPAAWALLAAIAALLAPFYVHEIFFTWPKLLTAGFVLSAFVLILRHRPFSAGLTLGLAYLLHPLAVFSVPFFGIGLLVREWQRHRGWRALVAPAVFSVGVLLCVVPWTVQGRHAPLRNGSQTVFLDFFRLSDGRLETVAAVWWHDRWESFANTFVPFHMLTIDPSHQTINSVYGPSDGWVHAWFVYWNTLPLALGLPVFLLLVPAVGSATRRAPLAATLAFIAPALLMIIYWGASNTGIMRHCGHVLFLSFIVFGIWALGAHAGGWRRAAIRAFLHPLCFAWRGAEIAVMAFGTSFLHRWPQWQGPLGWNDGLSLAIAGACLGGAVILLAKAAAAIKHDFSAPAPAAASST